MESKSLIRVLSRRTESTKFIPEIDGLRFFAIATVVLFHLNTAIGKEMNLNSIQMLGGSEFLDSVGWWFVRLDLGVKVFFAISGFILAIPFIKAVKKGSHVNLKQYYLKRLTRLEPPYLITLFGFFIVQVYLFGENLQELVPHLLAGIFYANSSIYGGP